MPTPHRFVSLSPVIYCVVPEPLADELYPKLAAYYEDDPNVEVIVDRRKSERRDASAGGGQRECATGVVLESPAISRHCQPLEARRPRGRRIPWQSWTGRRGGCRVGA